MSRHTLLDMLDFSRLRSLISANPRLPIFIVLREVTRVCDQECSGLVITLFKLTYDAPTKGVHCSMVITAINYHYCIRER
jgi:hypothetical protein